MQLFILFCLLGTLLGCTNPNADIKNYLESKYTETGVNGYLIPEKEKKHIERSGGDPLYGEITLESAEILVEKYLKLNSLDVFYDLGSGVGKFVFFVYLTSHAKKVVGIELSKTRYEGALQVLKELEKDQKIQSGRELNFLNQNILKADFSDATVIFISCFAGKVLDHIVQNAKPETRIVSLAYLTNPRLELLVSTKLRMSWHIVPGESAPIYIFKIKDETT